MSRIQADFETGVIDPLDHLRDRFGAPEGCGNVFEGEGGAEMLGHRNQPFQALPEPVGSVAHTGRPRSRGVDNGDPRAQFRHARDGALDGVDGIQALFGLRVGEGEPFSRPGFAQMAVKGGMETHGLKGEIREPLPEARDRLRIFEFEMRPHGPELDLAVPGLGDRFEVLKGQGLVGEEVG